MERVGPPVELARALGHATVHRLNAGRHEAALAAADRRLEVARSAALPVDVAEARIHRGQALWTLGRYAEARTELEGVVAEAAGSASDAAAKRLEPQALRLLGVIDHETGYLARAESYIRRALAAARKQGDLRGEATLTTNLGNVMTDLGRKEAALTAYAHALEACRRTGGREGETIAWVNIGLVRVHLGDLEGAEEALRASRAFCLELGLRRVEGYVLHGFGLVAAWRGDVVEARRRFEESVRLRLSLGNRHAAADALVALGSLEVRAGRDVDAYARLAEAVALAEQVGDPNLVVFALLWRAQLPGEDLEGPRRTFQAERPRMRHDGLLEAHWLLWRRSGDPKDLAEARAVLEELRAHAPASTRSSIVENVPHHREVASGDRTLWWKPRATR